ncbi:hypothetical protein ACROYT_G040294 [Oculina patagonica]
MCPRIELKEDMKQVDFFQLYFTEELWNHIVDQTNLYAEQKRGPVERSVWYVLTDPTVMSRDSNRKEMKDKNSPDYDKVFKACKSLADKRVAELNFTGRQDEGELFLGELTELSAVQGGEGESWKALVSINGQLIEFKEDSGADVTVIPQPETNFITKQDNQGTHGSMSTETELSRNVHSGVASLRQGY